jgi:hypothetical protein
MDFTNSLTGFGIRKTCLISGRSCCYTNLWKGNKIRIRNYGGISLLPTTYEILSSTILSRLSPFIDEIIVDHKCGFPHNRPSSGQVSVLNKYWKNKEI